MAKLETVDMIARLVALVQYIGLRGSVPREELMQTFDLSRAQLRNALREIAYLGELADRTMFSVELDDFGPEVSLRNLGVFERPLSLTPVEATALLVSMELLRDRLPEHDDFIMSAMVKVRSVAGAVMTGVNDSGLDTAVAFEATLRGAVGSHVVVDIMYVKAGAGSEPAPRQILPLGVIVDNDAAYVRAWCLTAGALRTFKVARIRSVRVTSESVTLTPEMVEAIKGDAVLSEPGYRISYSPDAQAQRIVLRVRPEAGWLVDYFDESECTIFDETLAEVAFETNDVQGIAGVVVSLGGAAEVVEPAWLRSQVVALAQAELDSLE